MNGQESIERALDVLPGWLPLGGLAFCCATAFLISAGFGLALGRIAGGPFRKYSGDSWTERARLGYPMRRAASIGCVVGLLAACGAPVLYDGPYAVTPRWVTWLLVLSSALVGGIIPVSFALRRILGDRITFGSSLRGEVTLALLMYPHILLAGTLAWALPPRFDLGVGAGMVAGFVLLAWLACGGGVFALRAFGICRLAPERLLRCVERTAGCLRMPSPRRVYVTSVPISNAFAIPLLGTLVFTERTLGLLDDAEIETIAAHEMGHLAEPKRIKASRLIAGVAVPSVLAFVQPLFALTGPYAVAGFLVAAFVIALWGKRQRVRWEEAADKVAHESPLADAVYARALEKLYRDNGAPAVIGEKNPSHPNLYDRITAAGVEPDYPRPDLPPKRPLRYAFIGFILILYSLLFPAMGAYETAFASRTLTMLRLGVTGGDSTALVWAGYFYEDRDRVLLHDAAAAMARHDAWPIHELAQSLINVEEWSRARDALDEAERRATEAGRTERFREWRDDMKAAIEEGDPR